MNKLRLLKDPGELRLLGNPHAYEILNLLRGKEYSGSELAKTLDIKAQHITYYLNRLEKKGLAEVVRVGKRREKFFRATAEKFVVYSDVGEGADLVNRSLRSAYMDTLQFSSHREKIEKYIRMILSGILQVREGTKVVMVFTEDSIQFLRLFLMELRDLEARYRLLHNCPQLAEQLWTRLSVEGVRRVYQDMEEHVNWGDVYIVLGMHRVPDLSDVPQERADQLLPIRRKAISTYLNKDFPRMQVFLPPYHDDTISDPLLQESLEMFWNAASLDLKDYQRMKAISGFLLECETLEIRTGKDCCLTVRLNPDHSMLDAGPCSSRIHGMTYNMPSGEFTVLPAPKGINGRIFLEKATREHIPSGTTLVIQDNIVTSATAEEGGELLQSRLEDFGVPGRTVGLICFGLNPEILDPKILPEMRSLMCGCVNLTFGDNSDLGGDIRNIVNWELTSHRPTITANGKRILHRNRYRIP